MKKTLPVIRLCWFFGLTRQAYYKAICRRQQQTLQQQVITGMVQQIRHIHVRMGAKKLYHLLGPDIHQVMPSMGRDKFFDLLRERHLLVKRRRKYAVTTQSYHRFRKHTNKLKDLIATRPHQGWVGDITYLRTQSGFVYLFLLTDVYSRKIVGWELSKSLGIDGAIKCLRKAMCQCPSPKGLIHHTDRGLQYCAPEYVRIQKSKGIQTSMGEVGNCYDNAMAERMNGILKSEYSLDETFKNESQAHRAVKEGIQVYNEQRPHWSLKLAIPSQMHG